MYGDARPLLQTVPADGVGRHPKERVEREQRPDLAGGPGSAGPNGGHLAPDRMRKRRG